MAKLTKAAARRRLLEAQAKFQKVYIGQSPYHHSPSAIVKTSDMEAVEKIVARCLKRIQ